MHAKFYSILAFIIFSFLPCSGLCESTKLAWQDTTAQTKAWTRWWWLGSILDKEGITTEMEKYAAAGLGGLEITPIYGVHGYEDRFLDYLTPEWVAMLEHTLQEAERLEMQIDMATGNGWPFGGPWVTPNDACKNVLFHRYTLKEGESLNKPVTYTQETMARAEGHRVIIEDLSDPVASNDNLQQLALTQVRFARPLPLMTLMAYNEDGKTEDRNAIDLTGKVSSDGTLDWTAPKGTWTLYAVFQGWHGKQVERAGPGGEGDVIDHFSRTALQRYLTRFDQAFDGANTGSMRAYFNDSYEVDDAAGESNWTDDFLDEFYQRRGYDLRQQLPALFSSENNENSLRVKCDYRETISDLLLEEFTIPWREWAKTHNALIRNQAHGSPANILDLYAASSIPETEGQSIYRFQFASSAAHVSEIPITACEASTWLGEHFLNTLADVKRNVDDYFLGGVNHIVYHGTPYSPPEAGYPGWMFYASVHFGTTNSFWNHFSALNDYVEKTQGFLQAGKPANDVLLYFPFYDAISQPTRGSLVHFSGREPGNRSAGELAEAMFDRGYSFDHISDQQISNLRVQDGMLQTGGISYKAVVIPETQFIPLNTFETITALARQGAKIIVHNQLPQDVPGMANLKQRQTSLSDMKNDFIWNNSQPGIKRAVLGLGMVLLGSDIDALLTAADVHRETLVDHGLEFIRRKDGNHDYYFIANKSDEPISGWILLQTEAVSAALFNPMKGQSGNAEWRSESSEIYLQLEAGESCIVKTFADSIDAPMYPYVKPAGDAIPLKDGWSLSFVNGGPDFPPALDRTELGSWTENEGEGYKSFSGTGNYQITFQLPENDCDAWYLDLGKVADSAEVILNGETVGTLICEPYRVCIPKEKLRNTNRLDIRVINLMANRMADLDRNDPSWKRFYNINFPARIRTNRGEDGLFSAAQWKPRESGLMGPVQLIPCKTVSSP